ncbi:MAG TPA: NAD(+)/NADH kinase [Steroidobacteraceae bacterium]|nr:NAD(+)/NADH kinase [Steroidobacteraceae bacterium]
MSNGAVERKCIALAGRAVEPRVAEAMLLLARHLLELGHRVRAARDDGLPTEGLALESVEESELARGAQLLVAVGGDGTMLHAAHMAAQADVPVLGINRGRLGFLADVGPERMVESVDEALAGHCPQDRRMLLRATVSAGGHSVSALALNDVVVAKRETGRMVDIRSWVDDTYVNTHSGDGFLVATSTGSTAYSLSCGGPIVHPSLNALVLVPICPHTLSDRPIVVGGDSIIGIEIADRFEARAQVVCDGVVLCDLEPGERLRIERAPVSVTFLHPPGHNYYRILRSKLNWGRGTRDGQPPGA